MAHSTHRFILHPQTAFGTPLVGDTLFGQFCWALRRRFGVARLDSLLENYTEGKPFLVFSDAFPHGFLPLPTIPSSLWHVTDEDRKALKKRRWLPVEELESDFPAWQNLARNDADAAKAVLQKYASPDSMKEKEKPIPLQKIQPQPHNTLNRETATTGEGAFAPYTQAQYWFHPEMRFDLYAVMDETRITAEEVSAALADMGQSGYGRDASIGLGKFKSDRDTKFSGLPRKGNANAWLTLAPCAPQGQGFIRERSFYQIQTRFGRHGDIAVHSGNPFKRPLLLAKSGGVFSPETLEPERLFIGQGLGHVSPVHPEAVAQAYAPVIGIRMENAQ
jgi:CRISPR-associated protein Csm4